jgi:hypothetical protein
MVSFVLNSIEEGWQVYSIYMDFSKVFDQVRHQLVLEEMSASYLWLRSYLTGKIQRIRIGDAVSKDISVTSGFCDVRVDNDERLQKRFIR